MEDGTQQKLVEIAWDLATSRGASRAETLKTFRVYYRHLAQSVLQAKNSSRMAPANEMYKESDEALDAFAAD